MSDLVEFLTARLDEDKEDLDNARLGDMPEWWAPDAWSRKRGEAEIEAKRRIVEGCVESQYGWILRELVAIYADHPDYREEWRP